MLIVFFAQLISELVSWLEGIVVYVDSYDWAARVAGYVIPVVIGLAGIVLNHIPDDTLLVLEGMLLFNIALRGTEWAVTLYKAIQGMIRR